MPLQQRSSHPLVGPFYLSLSLFQWEQSRLPAPAIAGEGQTAWRKQQFDDGGSERVDQHRCTQKHCARANPTASESEGALSRDSDRAAAIPCDVHTSAQRAGGDDDALTAHILAHAFRPLSAAAVGSGSANAQNPNRIVLWPLSLRVSPIKQQKKKRQKVHSGTDHSNRSQNNQS